MKEVFLHFVWKNHLLDSPLFSIEDEEIEIISPGIQNPNDGPDFLDAKIRIGDKIWAGSVEIHKKSSDWTHHKHETNGFYKNLILHVVFDHDKEQKVLTERRVSTLEIKKSIPKNYVENFLLFQEKIKEPIPCSSLFSGIKDFSTLNDWYQNLYIERLKQKVEFLEELLEKFENNWEKLCFVVLARAFGNKTNSQELMEWAEKIPIERLRKYSHDLMELEALFFGTAGFLEDKNQEENYFLALQQSYEHQKALHNLSAKNHNEFKWKGVRPQNFITIRLAQLAALYNKHQSVLQAVVDSNHTKELQSIFQNIGVSNYWKENYHFGKAEKIPSNRKIGDEFLDKILINALLPIRKLWRKNILKEEISEEIFWISELKAEKNSIVESYQKIGFPIQNALESQAILQLKKNYCDQKKCLNCNVGKKILSL